MITDAQQLPLLVWQQLPVGSGKIAVTQFWFVGFQVTVTSPRRDIPNSYQT
jgi:hypothetical protein